MKGLLFTFAVILSAILCPGAIASVNRFPSYIKFGFDRAIDSRGGVFIVSADCNSKSECRYVVAKYDKEGKHLWSRQGAGMGPITDFFAAVVTDEQGAVYVVQRVPGYAPAPEKLVAEYRFGYVVDKYDAKGRKVWTAQGRLNEQDALDPTGMAVGKNGDVYVTGTCTQRGEGRHTVGDLNDMLDHDILTEKYDKEGGLLWSARYAGPAGNDDWPKDVSVDVKGNVYIAGTSTPAKRGGQFVTLKYDAAGSLRWARYYTPRRGAFSGAEHLVVDDRAAVYVLGSSMTLENRRMELVTVKYDTSGQEQWVAKYSDKLKKSAHPVGIAKDVHGSIHVAAYISPSYWETAEPNTWSNATGEYLVIKYSATGKQQWVAKYEKPLSVQGWINKIKVDTKGAVYLVGQIESEALIVKFDSTGKQQWAKRFTSISEFLKVLSTLKGL
jgi:hypothetical protein